MFEITEITVSQLAFVGLALAIAVFSVLSVTSRRILRSATYLLFVLIATAGLYFLMDYVFLAAVQLTVYAGGIMVLLIFAIYLTGEAGQKISRLPKQKMLAGITASFAGLVLLAFVILKNVDKFKMAAASDEIEMQAIGSTLMGTDKFQYLLPFEAVSVFLLACIIGGIVIARKDKKIKE
jgi:NADH-quinone oxidoreductase subunit J